MKRPLAVVLALAVLAGLAWVGRSFLASSPPARAAAPGAAPTPAAVAPTAQDELAAPDVERPGPGAGAGDLAAAEARVELREDAPQGPQVVRTVHVTDGATGSPVAGARVLWASIDPETKHREHPSWDLERCDAWLAEHGQEQVSGPDGTLQLTLPEGGEANVFATVDGKAGRTHVRAKGPRAMALKLVPDGPLEVLAVDAAGAPVEGVPIGLVRMGQAWGRTPSQAQRTTDAEGRVRYAHLGLTVTLDKQRYGVGARDVLGGPPAVALDPDDLPDDPVVLTVPATGVVVVEVLPGAWGDDLGSTRLELLRDEGVEDERLSFWSRPESVPTEVEDGRARFGHVALGLDLIVEARGGHWGVPTRLRLRGPDQPGQVVEATLTLGQDHPVLRARVLDAAGTALVGHDVDWRIGVVDDLDGETPIGDEGALVVHLPPRAAQGSGRVLHLEVAASGERAGGTAELALPDVLPVGLTDLGEVRVAVGSPLVSGVVRGPDGAPVKGADVRVEAINEWGEGNRYYEDLELGVESGEDGSFVAWGSDPGQELRVSASHATGSSLAVECGVGTSGLALDLLAGGTVAGRVLLDEGVDAGRLDVTLRPAGPGGENDWHNRGRGDLEPDGSFEVEDLRPGPYDLYVRASRGGSEILALEGLEVPAGGPCSDPRLAAIDLRGRLLAFEVELVPPTADARVMGTIKVRPVGAAEDEDDDSVFLQGTSAQVLVEARAVDLTIDVQGYRRVELRDVRADVQVELRRGLPVRLRIPADVPLPEPPKYLKAYLTPAEDNSMAFGHFLDVVFDEQREILVHAPTAGRLQVQWLLEERAENSLTTSGLHGEEPVFVEVLDVEGEQSFDVEPPREALESRLGDG